MGLIMDNKRKKIIAYLHPSIYPQDKLTQQYVEGLPVQVRGEFYRQAIICGVALSSIDPRLANLISGFFNGSITAGDVIGLIEQVTGHQSNRVGVDGFIEAISGGSVVPQNNTIPEVGQAEGNAIKNLSMLKK
ncbi:conserved hypothetical protein [Enterobacterales bacterium 8AC]|nr:conserved hypothetical protein [Enterobacterales bacterium 8AC]